MSRFVQFKSIPDLFRFFNLDQPVRHPLVAVIDFSKVSEHITEDTKVAGDFYALIFKNYNRNNIRYGRKLVDFNDGSLICLAPQQVLEMNLDTETSPLLKGWGLFFHPDLVRPTSLGPKMKDYSFFAYEVSEALHLSEKEEQILSESIQKIDTELNENIDIHSQSIITSGIEMLLNYCSRFYGRQFITRKSSNNMVVAQVENLLNQYFNNKENVGLPTVKFLANNINLSPSYLSDLLKKETGKNAQDHIHHFIIEQAKNILLSTDHSISEIAYQLGFEYPQYFNKLFKQKTGMTPVEFRKN